MRIDVSVMKERERETGTLYMDSEPWHVRVHLVEITTKQIINFLCECNLVEHTGKNATTPHKNNQIEIDGWIYCAS